MKPITTSLFLALFCSTALLSANLEAQGQLYKWVDENGVTHFSQQPPPEELDLEPTSINSAPVISGSEPQSSTNSATKKVNEEPEPTEIASSEQPAPKKDAARCSTAKETITTLTNSPRIRVLDEETGEYNYIDDEEKQKQMTAWQKEQSTYC